MKKPLIILTGPTAVGKTELSLRLAKQVNGAIISADSMQVYKYMDIGTAKISEAKRQGAGDRHPQRPYAGAISPTQQNICTISIINNPLFFYKGLSGFCV